MANGLYGGGAEKILQTLLDNLDKDRYDITLYNVIYEHLDINIYPKHVLYKTVFSGTINNNALNNLWIKIKNKIKLYIYNHCNTRVFYKLFIKGSYDIEVAFIEGYSTKILSGSNQESTKIAWVHIDLEANHWTKIAYKSLEQEKQCYKKYNHIVCVSESVKEAFSRKFNITRNLTVKYNPVDRADILKKAQETINTPKAVGYRLITVGRLEPQKGYDRLLEVASRLKQARIDFELWILGEGKQRPELENLIKKHQLDNVVKLIGFVSNPYKFIAVSDIFVCSSRSEGYSTVVTEALILGKPVVATNCSGMIELLGNSEYGLITDNNEKALYLGLKEILTNKKSYQYYKAKSQIRSNTFDINTTMRDIEKLWI